MSRLQLSVVMPVYNVAPWVQSAISSILRQTYENFELIVVEGGSTDGTGDLVASIKDHRVRVIHRGREGFLKDLAVGIREAKGEWIARMDGDDVSHPERFQRSLDFVKEHPDCLMVGTALGYLTPNGTILRPKGLDFEWRQLTRSLLSHGRIFCEASTIFQRRAAMDVGLYDLEFPRNETSLWYRLLSRGIGYEIGSCLYFYRYYSANAITAQLASRRDAAGIRQRYDLEGYQAYYSMFSRLFAHPRDVQIEKCFSVVKQCRAGRDYIGMFRYTTKALLLSRSYQSFRKIIEAFTGINSLRIWKWPKAFVKSEFEVFAPETPYVSNIFAELGLKFNQIRVER